MSAAQINTTTTNSPLIIQHISSNIIQDVYSRTLSLQVPKLKNILRDCSLKLSGKKQDLILRIVLTCFQHFVAARSEVTAYCHGTSNILYSYQILYSIMVALDKYAPSCCSSKFLYFSFDRNIPLNEEVMDGYHEVKFQVIGPLQFKAILLKKVKLFKEYSLSIPSTSRLYLWCYPESSSTHLHSWPLNSKVRINGIEQPIIQRKQSVFNGETTIKGFSAPLDVTQQLFEQVACDTPEIEIITRDSTKHLAFLQFVELKSVEDILNDLFKNQILSLEASIIKVKKSFHYQKNLENNDDDNIEDDDDVVASSTRISHRCPIGLVPIDLPARGRNCNHLQCFDLRTFLNMNKNCCVARFRCGVCSNIVPIKDIIIDSFFLSIIQQIRLGKKNNIQLSSSSSSSHSSPILSGLGISSINNSSSSGSSKCVADWEVEIEPNSTWHLVEEEVADSPTKPLPKKRNHVALSSTSSNNSKVKKPAVPPPPPPPLPIQEGDLVDLTLTDSEDDV